MVRSTLGCKAQRIATHEPSFTLRGATYGMQNKMELRQSCLIVATHDTSCASSGARGVTLQHHQILNIAPATKNHFNDWASKHMRPCQNSLSAYLSENPGHRSGWGPHRFTWLGDWVLVLVLTCREMPLS